MNNILKEEFEGLFRLQESDLSKDFKVSQFKNLIGKVLPKTEDVEKKYYFLDKASMLMIDLQVFLEASNPDTALLDFLGSLKPGTGVFKLGEDDLSGKNFDNENVPFVLKNLKSKDKKSNDKFTRQLCITAFYSSKLEEAAAVCPGIKVTGSLAISSLLQSQIKVENGFPAKLFKGTPGEKTTDLLYSTIEDLLKTFSEKDSIPYEFSEKHLKVFLENTKDTWTSFKDAAQELELLKDSLTVSFKNQKLIFKAKEGALEGGKVLSDLSKLYTATPNQAEGVEAFLISLALTLFKEEGSVPENFSKIIPESLKRVVFPTDENYPVADFLLLGDNTEDATFISCKKGSSGNRNIQAMKYFVSNLDSILNVIKGTAKPGENLELNDTDKEALKRIFYPKEGEEREKATPSKVVEALETETQNNPGLPTRILYDFFSEMKNKTIKNNPYLAQYFSNFLNSLKGASPATLETIKVWREDTSQTLINQFPWLNKNFYLGGLKLTRGSKGEIKTYKPQPCLSYLEYLVSKALKMVELSDILVTYILKNFSKDVKIYKVFLNEGLVFQKLNIDKNLVFSGKIPDEILKSLQEFIDTYQIDITNSSTNGSLKGVIKNDFLELGGKPSGVIFKGKTHKDLDSEEASKPEGGALTPDIMKKYWARLNAEKQT